MLHLILPASWIVDCNYVLASKASAPDQEMAHLIALHYDGESASVPACLCDGAGTLYGDMIITPLQCACLGKSRFTRAFTLRMSTAVGNKTAVNVFYAARLRRHLSNDIPEHEFFCFFSFPKLFIMGYSFERCN